PLLRMFRFSNTALDVLFYDVEALRLSLLAKNTLIHTSLAARSVSHPFDFLDLTALTNPSGSIIVVDSNSAPYIRPPFREMSQFFDYANGPDGAALHTLAITGVGSSAYGAVAFAWDISTALGELVAAVVPGYGLADVVPQALGGWFGFEVYDALQTATQSFLARFAPSLALIGKDLARTTPGHACASTGAPVFRHGSAASDDVHAILQEVPGITRVIGHSKGALAIENALRSLSGGAHGAPCRYHLWLRHLGAMTQAKYTQYLGWFDTLGILNSWWHVPEFRPLSHHSTNTFIPLSMRVADTVNGVATRAGR